MAEYDLSPGEMVGEYRIERKIGEGGFGKVYAAAHPVIGKAAAVKILNPELAKNADIVGRFIDEARAVNQIRHRNIIDIFAFGTLPSGLHYFVMELLEGIPLDDYVKKHAPLDPAHALALLWPVGRALVAAHKAGIAHRDLKPENVFLQSDGEGGLFPKLLDFGIAKLLNESEMAHRTKTGAVMGTPIYMSPEQCRGSGVDQRSDIYSFGIMVHEVMTGRRPFEGTTIVELIMKQVSEPPPPMSQSRPDLPRSFDSAVLHMLAKGAHERPQTMQAALDELAQAARAAGVLVPSASQGSIQPAKPPALPQGATMGATGLDTGAWLERNSSPQQTPPPAHASQPAHTPSGGQTPTPGHVSALATAPTYQNTAPAMTGGAPAQNTAGGPYTGTYGQGSHPGVGPHYPPQGPTLQSAGAGAPALHSAGHAAYPAPKKPGSSLGVVLAIVGGLFVLFLVGAIGFMGLESAGGDAAEIRMTPPPVGDQIARDVTASMDMAFTAAGYQTPKATAEVKSRRQFRLTVQSANDDEILASEVVYGDVWTTTKIGTEEPQTERAPVAGKSYAVTVAGEDVVVRTASGQEVGPREEAEVLSDIGAAMLPRSVAFAEGIDIGETVTLGSDDALTLLGLEATDPDTRVRADNASLKLVSHEGQRAQFQVTLAFVHDGGQPNMHIECPLKGLVTLDTRSGLPQAMSLQGPVTGTIQSPEGPLTISGTMKIEGK